MATKQSIAEQLTQLGLIKAAIRSAIQAQGVTVPSDAPFASYANYISQISNADSISALLLENNEYINIE